MKVGIGCLTSYRFTSLDVGCGGEYRYLLQLAKAATALGHEVFVFVEPATNQPEFAESNVKFIHYPKIRDIQPDVVISQDTHFFYEHAAPTGCRLYLFSSGNPDAFAWYDRIDGIITYNRSVPVWVEKQKGFRRTHLIYPYIPKIIVERDKSRVVCATTELHSYNRPLMAINIARALQAIGNYDLYYFYRPEWLEQAIMNEQKEDEQAYLVSVCEAFKSAPTNFFPKSFLSYYAFQRFLAASGFFLIVREGAEIALTESEAMFHGVCCVRAECVPYFAEGAEAVARFIHFCYSHTDVYDYYSSLGEKITQNRSFGNMCRLLKEIL